MKFSLFALALFLAAAPLPASPLDAKGETKITKNEAEHIALREHPGARIQAAKLETVDGKLLWSLQLVEGKTQATDAIAVDATTGRIVNPAKQKP